MIIVIFQNHVESSQRFYFHHPPKKARLYVSDPPELEIFAESVACGNRWVMGDLFGNEGERRVIEFVGFA